MRVREEIEATLRRKCRESAQTSWRAGELKTSRAVDQAAKDALLYVPGEVDKIIEALGQRAADAWAMAGILERDGLDATKVRENAAMWTAYHERWIAEGGPEEHVKRLRDLAEATSKHLGGVSPQFSDESMNDWIDDIVDKRRRADAMEAAYAEPGT